FPSYVATQRKVEEAYDDRHRWLAMSIANAAGSGKFSSDRTIEEYAREIWRAVPVPIENGKS
ncbi:MAG: glycogen/starch/alpha-glucan phosphorylase, partial [Planctomycetes bacterium]|nr:glycogen/starch/alpha-glucan phosphorylase [Planctomycetota bacterium]